MKILYILNSGNPGGMEQHVLDLVRYMTDHGHKVYVWCREGVVADWYRQAQAQVTTISINIEIDPVYIYKLVKFLRQEKIEIIHAHELKPVVNSVIAGFISRVKVRITHTHTPISTWKIGSAAKVINTLVNTWVVNILATKEIALTESRKEIKKNEGIREEKLEIIPNGLDTQNFDISPQLKQSYSFEIRNKHQIPKDAFIFGLVSRLTEEKGHEVLIKAFKKLLEYSLLNKENIYLMLVGGGRLEEKLKELASECGLSERVIFTGVFREEDKVKYYSAIDIFVFPSLTEGFGLVLIEAMYSKLPIVCSNLEVLQEVGGSTVMYFEVGNSDDLAEKMMNLYQKKDRLTELTESARARVEQLYTYEKFGDNYENLYFNLLNPHA